MTRVICVENIHSFKAIIFRFSSGETKVDDKLLIRFDPQKNPPLVVAEVFPYSVVCMYRLRSSLSYLIFDKNFKVLHKQLFKYCVK